jgi:hypothetical protein
MKRLFRKRPLWIVCTFAVAFVGGCSVVQTIRYRQAAEPFSRVGAWVYSGGDDMGIHLFGPDGIREVFFYDEQFSDAELASLRSNLAQLPKLRCLRLRNTKITDVGLQHLTGLQLGQIDLHGTNVSAAGVQHFKRQMPSCIVYWQPFQEADLVP